MKAWWDGLSLREQRLIAVMGAVIGLFVILQFIVGPIGAWRADAQSRAQGGETTYRLVAEAVSRGAPAAGGAADEETPVRTALMRTARGENVTLTFVNARPDGSVETQIAAVEPDRLYRFFDALAAGYGVEVLRADIARASDEAGQVRAQLTFSR